MSVGGTNVETGRAADRPGLSLNDHHRRLVHMSRYVNDDDDPFGDVIQSKVRIHLASKLEGDGDGYATV